MDYTKAQTVKDNIWTVQPGSPARESRAAGTKLWVALSLLLGLGHRKINEGRRRSLGASRLIPAETLSFLLTCLLSFKLVPNSIALLPSVYTARPGPAFASRSALCPARPPRDISGVCTQLMIVRNILE